MCDYSLHILLYFSVDATAESRNLGRLVNHSRLRANLHAEVITVLGGPRIILHAKHNIKAGTELLLDYGDRNKDSLEQYPWLKA